MSKVSEIDVARKLTDCDESLDSRLLYVASLTDIEWSRPNTEPDIVRALVLDHLYSDMPLEQEKALSLLLNLVRTMTDDRLKTLLRKDSNIALFKLCLQRYNALNEGESEAQLFQSIEEDVDGALSDCGNQLRFPCLLFKHTQVLQTEE